MKQFFLIFIIFMAYASSAKASHQTKIAIITSFKTTDGKSIFNFVNYDSNKKVENKFKKHFDPKKFNLKIIHHASLSDLWNVLHDESIDALFFIGHGAESNEGPIGLGPIILDEDLVNLKYAFSSVSSNLKYLAVISCFSEKVISPFIQKGFFKNAPNLKVTTFPEKIEIMKGIDIAIENSLATITASNFNGELVPMNFEDILSSDKTTNDEVEALELTRSYGEEHNLPALIVYNEKAIGFFDGKNTSKTILINFPKKDLMKSTKSIVIDTGQIMLNQKLNIGELMLSGDMSRHCQLDAERNKKGEILGVSKNYYNLKCDFLH